MSNPELDAATPSIASADIDWKDKAEAAEQRRKDTQSAYTKNQQRLKQIEAENEILKQQVSKKVEIPADKAKELDDLKYEDPDKWRIRVNEIEREVRLANESKINDLAEEARQKAGQNFELEQRKTTLAEFQEKHGADALTDDIIANDVPPRITAKLEKGEITFGEFLNEAYSYVKTGKTVANPDILGQPDLTKVGGGAAPSTNEQSIQATDDYSKVIF